MALKNANYGRGWRLQLIFYRLFGLLLNTLLHLTSDHKFIGLRLACCRKRKGQWLIHVTKESWKAQGTDFSKFHPHEERLARRIYIHQALFILRLNREGLYQTFSCFVAWDLTNTLRALQADSSEAFLHMAAERYHVLYSNSSTWALELDTTAELLFVPALARSKSAIFCIFELFLTGRLLSLE